MDTFLFIVILKKGRKKVMDSMLKEIHHSSYKNTLSLKEGWNRIDDLVLHLGNEQCIKKKTPFICSSGVRTATIYGLEPRVGVMMYSLPPVNHRDTT